MSCISVPTILMPKKGTDLSKWAVVACDQYTSQPEYWQKADHIVGDAPSTLRLTLPEVYLEDADVSERTERIYDTMKQYLSDGTMIQFPAGFILTERWSGSEVPRRGLVAAVDLEAYEYKPGSRSLIRPTEKTVEERIPPRLAVRNGAVMELPHIMLLIDDPKRAIIEPLFEQLDLFEQVYDTDLMLDGGHINGWFIPQGVVTDTIISMFEGLNNRKTFNEKYHLTEDLPLLPFAVGDGNHSMATAKAYWEALKPSLSEEEIATHPARFALCEIVNIHDESLVIEPIHRVLFDADADNLFAAAKTFYAAHGADCEITETAPENAEDAHVFPFCTADCTGYVTVRKPQWGIALATLQAFLDDYMSTRSAVKIDYIHGEDVVKELGTKPNNIGFFLPDIEKNDLFRGVILDGVLPRKTFSMGEAHEKRYYMEAKMIVK